METTSVGSPLLTLATFSFAILLSFSSSVFQSQSTPRNPPSPAPPPPPANKGGTLPHAPRPRMGVHEHRPNHNPPRHSDKKHVESATKNNSGLNKGKLIGLLFAGIAVVLQIGVVGFLAYKRNQNYKDRD